MNHLLLQFFLVCFLLVWQSPCNLNKNVNIVSISTAKDSICLMPVEVVIPKWSKVYESKFHFIWDKNLYEYVMTSYNDSSRFYSRLAQTYAESAFNPTATSDYGNWKRDKIDTITAILSGKGAAGISQFIWNTGKRYNATSVNPKSANDTSYRTDLYNPYWSLKSMCKYMTDVEFYIMTTNNQEARRALQFDKEFLELCATSSYNTGEGRIRDRLNRFGDSWIEISNSILPEPKNYSEKIIKVAKDMKVSERWRVIK